MIGHLPTDVRVKDVIFLKNFYQKNMSLTLNISSSDLAKKGSSSLQSHIAYTQNKNKTTKTVSRGEGG